MVNLPFAFVEKELPRKYSKFGPISKYTLMKYLDQLGYECEEILKRAVGQYVATGDRRGLGELS